MKHKENGSWGMWGNRQWGTVSAVTPSVAITLPQTLHLSVQRSFESIFPIQIWDFRASLLHAQAMPSPQNG
jgi:hypothetical protein